MLGRRGANKRLLGGLLTMVGMAAARGTGQAQAPHPKVPANFPYPVHWIPGSKAFAEWQRLRQLGRGWPIVVGDAEALELLSQSLVPADRPAPAAVLQAASKLHHPQSLFDHRRKELDAVRAYAKPGVWPHAPLGAGSRSNHPNSNMLALPSQTLWAGRQLLRDPGACRSKYRSLSTV